MLKIIFSKGLSFVKSRIFLVDSENISDYNFIDINNVNQNDEIVIFASKVSKSIKINCLERILNSKAKVSFEWVETGAKNELDFQLVAYLALNLKADTGCYIVSRDNGFNSVINYIKKQSPTSNIQLLQENQKAPDGEKINQQKALEIVESSLTALKSNQLRKKARNVVNEWIKGKHTYSQARKKLEAALWNVGLRGKVNDSLCGQIIDSNKELVERLKAS